MTGPRGLPRGGVDLATSDAADAWGPRRANRFCPLHRPLSVDADGGGGVLFTPSRPGGLDTFSLAVRNLPEGALLVEGGHSPSGGLLLTYSGLSVAEEFSGPGELRGGRLPTEPAPWRLVLRPGTWSTLSFVAAFEVRPNGPRSLFVPWSAFAARLLQLGSIWQVNAELVLADIKSLEIMSPQHKRSRDAGEVARLALHSAVVVGPIQEANTTTVELNATGRVKYEAECLCDAQCARFVLERAATRSAGYCTWGRTAGRNVRVDDDGTFLDVCLAVLLGPATRVARGLNANACPSWTPLTPGVKAGAWLAAGVQAERFLRACMGPFSAARLLADVVGAVLSGGQLPAAPPVASADPVSSFGFFGPFVGKGITGRNDLGGLLGVTAEECVKACQRSPRCRSVDFGARGKVAGQCLLSTADRDVAWGLFEQWPLYDYYEKPLPVGPEGFLGPFVGMGVSGRNDLTFFKGLSRDECVQRCKAEPRCSSVDFGARGEVAGDCWLSTADRRSDRSLFTTWILYDYYEAPRSRNVSADSLRAAWRLADDQKSELLKMVPLAAKEASCCQKPTACAREVIGAGAPLFNAGDYLSCFYLYHAAVDVLRDCRRLRTGDLWWVSPVLEAADAGAGRSASALEASWVLRGALDALLATDACLAGVADEAFVPSGGAAPLELPSLTEVGRRGEGGDGPGSLASLSDNRSQYLAPAHQSVVEMMGQGRDIVESARLPVLVTALVAVALVAALLLVPLWILRCRKRARIHEITMAAMEAEAANPYLVVGRPITIVRGGGFPVTQGMSLPVKAPESPGSAGSGMMTDDARSVLS